MAKIINPEERKLHKLSQAAIDSSFAYLNAFRGGSMYQKTVKKKALIRDIENLHEFLEGSGKLLKIKPPKKILTYRTESKMVHIINKD